MIPEQDRYFFEQQLIDKVFGRLVNTPLLGFFDELTTTGCTFVVLLAIMDLWIRPFLTTL
jgi:hypothetical protein